MKVYLLIQRSFIKGSLAEPVISTKCFLDRKKAQFEYGMFAKRLEDIAAKDEDCWVDKSTTELHNGTARNIALYKDERTYIEHGDEVAEPGDPVDVWQRSVSLIEQTTEEGEQPCTPTP